MLEQDLLRVVRDRTPEELSPEEIRALRTWLPKSPAIRSALGGFMQSQSYLAAALERLPREERAARPQRSGPGFGAACVGAVGTLACLAMLTLLGGTLRFAWQVAQESVVEEEAPVEPEVPTTEEPPPEAVAETPDAPPKAAPIAWPLTIEAEAFARGNVVVDDAEFGAKETVVVRAEKPPAWVEYDFELPETTALHVRLRYASFDSRPLMVAVNGEKAERPVGGAQTGGALPVHQRWDTIGQFAFAAGKNVLRLETNGNFPILDRLELDIEARETPPSSGTPTVPLPVPPVAAAVPWQAVLDDPREPPAFYDVCFEPLDAPPSRKDLEQWFEPVPGQPLRFTDATTRAGKSQAFDGMMRLRAPLRDDLALRLSLEASNFLHVHFHRGTEGLTFVYYANDNDRWAAYRTTRTAGPKPESYLLQQTDEDRARRTEIRFSGPIELRHRDGELILSRGDVVLLRSKFPEPPEQIVFAGRATFRGLALVRTKDFPLAAPAPLPVAQELNAGDLDWTSTIAEGVTLTRHADGSAELATANAKPRGVLTAPLPLGLHAVEVEVQAATPGVGLFLAGSDQDVFPVVKVVKNRQTNGLCVVGGDLDDTAISDLFAPDSRLVNSVGERFWLRFLYGCGQLRWWLSPDGEQWAAPERGRTRLATGATHLGVFYAGALPSTQLRLGRVRLCRLPELTSLVAADVLPRARSAPRQPDLGQWSADVAAALPDGIDVGEWRRACALATLGAGCSRDLGHALVDLLLDDAAERGFPLDRQLRLLQEASLLVDVRDETLPLHAWLQRFHRLGRQAFDRGERPFSWVRSALHNVPLNTPQWVRVADAGAIRSELLQLLHQAKWRDTLEFCKRLRFFEQHQQLAVVEWAEYTARRLSPLRPGMARPGTVKANWAHPFVEEMSKETYNQLAELHSTLASDGFDDAARMITSLDGDSFVGLAPSGFDRELLHSLPVAVQAAQAQYPPLRTRLNEQFGTLATLRVRQAIRDQRVGTLELAAVQFQGTEAAAEARAWLGDRALSDGWFSRALAEYRRAQTSAGISLKQELLARARLAAALLGRDEGSAVTAAVKIGEFQLTPADFEKLVQELVQTRRTTGDTGPATAPVTAVPAPAKFTARTIGPLNFPTGDSPATDVLAQIKLFDIDLAGRTLATTVSGDRLYVSNRFQIAAFQAGTGENVWRQTEFPDPRPLKADWSFQPMRPVVTAQHVFGRQLYGQGPLLVCLDKQSGKLLWKTDPKSLDHVLTDPLPQSDRVLALTATRVENGDYVFRLVAYSLANGSVLLRNEVLRLREVWFQRRGCQAVWLDDSLVASFGGVTMCCDLAGSLRWARRQVVLPTTEDATWMQQAFDPPQYRAGRLFLVQPGVRTVDCLDAETGARQWQTVLPDVQRITALTANRLVVRTAEGFMGLDAATGEVRWSFPLADVGEGVLSADRGPLLVTCRETVKEKSARRPVLLWLDPEQGTELGRTGLDELTLPDPRFGPLVRAADGRLFAFTGAAAHPLRDLVELTPAGALPAVSVASRDVWSRHVPLELASAVGQQFAGWTLWNGLAGVKAGLLPEVEGETNVVALDTQPGTPILLTTRIAATAGGPKKVRVRLGAPTGTKLRLQLLSNDRVLADQEVPAAPWSDLDLPLPALAPGQHHLTLRLLPVSPTARTVTYWKRIEAAN